MGIDDIDEYVESVERREMGWFITAVIFMVIVVGLIGFSVWQYTTYKDNLDTFQMILDFPHPVDRVEGAYFHHADYYCVWTKGKPSREIIQFDVHEQCHVLTQNDYDHFCGTTDRGHIN